jgi:hypothetical protein
MAASRGHEAAAVSEPARLSGRNHTPGTLERIASRVAEVRALGLAVALAVVL